MKKTFSNRRLKKLVASVSSFALIINTLAISSFAVIAPAPANAQDLCPVDVDVVLIMDRSGSMGWESPTKLSLAKTAAKSFADNLGTNDQSGLVSYANTATLDKQLSNNHTLTKTKIDALSANGSTNIGDGILMANGELGSGRARAQAVKIEILLTDGLANQPNGDGNHENPLDVAYAKAKADAAAALGYKIFTIGLGTDVNTSMLQYIANVTGAQYYFSPSASDLDAIYDSIATRICQYASISGCKFNDSNNDGNISGETKLSGWEINLGGKATSTQLTDSSGCYTFAGLLSGNYTVSEGANTAQSPFVQTYPTPNSYAINLAAEQNITNKDFGNYLPRCGNSRLDSNYGEVCEIGDSQSCTTGEGYSGSQTCSSQCQWDPCEPTEFCGDGIVNDGEQCDNGITNGQFCSAPYGGTCNYCSSSCQPQTITGPSCGDLTKNGQEECDGTDGVPDTHHTCQADCTLLYIPFCGDQIVNQTSEACDGGTQACVDASGYNGVQACSGSCQWGTCVPQESCGDGILNDSEQCDPQDPFSIPEHNICTASCVLQYVPYCGDGATDPGEQCDRGGSNGQVCSPAYGGSCSYCTGSCQFVVLTGGSCGDGIKNGSEQCDGQSGVPEHYSCTNDCALTQNYGSINACKYEDADGDLFTTNDQIVVPGWNFTVTNGQSSSTLITGANGCALFTNLAAGMYTVSETATSGWMFLSPISGQKSVLASDNSTSTTSFYNFRHGMITGFKLEDHDGTASTTADQAPLSGWVINLFSTDTSTPMATTTTDTAGKYSFNNLTAGAYSLTENLLTNWQQLSSPTGIINILSGIISENNNFINFFQGPQGRISGCKYQDINNNGQIDQGDIKIGGWEIKLEKCNLNQSEQCDWTQVASTNTITDENLDNFGCYSFSGLESGRYKISETTQSGWTQTYPANPAYYDLSLSEQQPVVNTDFANFKNTSVEITGNGGGSGGSGIPNPQNNGTGYATTTPSQPGEVLGEKLNPVLTIEKKAEKSSVYAGDLSVPYSFTIKNTGSASAYEVTITDTLPDGFVFKDTKDTKKTWTIPVLAVGETKSFNYLVSIGKEVKPDYYTNTVKAVAINHSAIIANAKIQVKPPLVLGEKLTGTGFSLGEFILLLIILFTAAGSAIAIRKKMLKA